jgi:hypothetical protein
MDATTNVVWSREGASLDHASGLFDKFLRRQDRACEIA